MIALGSGGWTGLGLGNGRQKMGFVPEHHTDFIFSIIGEELGLIATLAVVLLFIAFMVCGVFIARRSSDAFGLLLGAGMTFMIGLQAFINIGGRHQRAAQQRHAAAVHQLRRLQPCADAGVGGFAHQHLPFCHGGRAAKGLQSV